MCDTGKIGNVRQEASQRAKHKRDKTGNVLCPLYK